jgi:hypoxanthine phosphoribosyltransferase
VSQSPPVLLSAQQISARVTELAEGISRDYAGRQLALVCVLRGAAIFLADLVRALQVPATVDFLAVSSYGRSTVSSGFVRITKDLEDSIQGKDVLVVEDILDSGRTLQFILETLKLRGPRSLRVCVLLDKPSRRAVELKAHYVGFTIPDLFVVGYGLDWAGRYRNLPYVGILPCEQEGCEQ